MISELQAALARANRLIGQQAEDNDKLVGSLLKRVEDAESELEILRSYPDMQRDLKLPYFIEVNGKTYSAKSIEAMVTTLAHVNDGGSHLMALIDERDALRASLIKFRDEHARATREANEIGYSEFNITAGMVVQMNQALGYAGKSQKAANE